MTLNREWYNNMSLKKNKKKLYKKLCFCELCGKKFKIRNKNMKYCSECREKMGYAYKLRRTPEELQKEN